jgi:DnaJ-domain-containing protein 1
MTQETKAAQHRARWHTLSAADLADEIERLEIINCELLEALEAITENAEYQRGTTYELSTRWIEKAEAAIAKARGL